MCRWLLEKRPKIPGTRASNATDSKTWKPLPNKTGSTYSCPWTDWVSPNPLRASSGTSPINVKSLNDMSKWLREKRPKIPGTQELDRRLPILPINVNAVLQPTDGVRVTWIGHATSLVQFDGINLLTDPMFSRVAEPTQYMGPLRYRLVPPNLSNLFDEMKIHAVLISHNHYDHLDYKSVTDLNRRFPEACCYSRRQHIKPEEAVNIHMDIRAKQSVAIHWCTFNLSNREYYQLVKDLYEARDNKLADPTSFIELKHGETKTFLSGASGRNPDLLLTAHTPTEGKQIPRRMASPR
ncbi:PREDICTED: N-acyl-phosphatidylethanolamine-hydrolyzing phospholipase D-like [Priapulus caudatus]|uniref:N-acyl-phosphatidylethanolamine-hydrolyzing phospholipase D-like n=1 Tax=Priapulus caudatus TaxID=37621 RepID=A0ABM1F4W7_PRICU|nr:PREDICTED: N-acyl-phosphatidylethanolamine-hydrolyzing phospholipase D-like [Priapulus caudatus]